MDAYELLSALDTLRDELVTDKKGIWILNELRKV